MIAYFVPLNLRFVTVIAIEGRNEHVLVHLRSTGPIRCRFLGPGIQVVAEHKQD